jgi:PPP family 3-phenylpropionic acid transporter
MDVLGKEKKSYGRIRAWGSISFITMVFVVGKVIDLYAVDVILILILGGSILLAIGSIRIPTVKPQKKDRISPKARSLLTANVVVFLFCAFLMLVSHGAYYGFFSIHLANMGQGGTFIGICWALATTAEFLVMLRSEKLFNRFSIENVLTFSFGVAAIRWLILFYATSPAVIAASQILHAVTYGMFHMASILYIDKMAPQTSKTIGQAVNNAVTYGLGLMVGFFLNGYLYEKIGSFALFSISCLIALAGGVIFRGFRMVNRD